MTKVSFFDRAPLTLAIGFILAIIVAMIPALPTYAATITWDGGGGDDNFSTGANWVGDVAPQAGDDLVFDNDTADFDADNPNNDLVADTSYNSITFTGGGNDDLEITGNDFELVNGITHDSLEGAFDISANITLTASQAFAVRDFYINNDLNLGTNDLDIDLAGYGGIGGDITGSGDINQTGGNLSVYGDTSSYSGDIVVDDGYLSADATSLGTAVGTTTINDGSSISIYECATSFTSGEDLFLNGDAYTYAGPKLIVGATCSGGGGSDEYYGVSEANSVATLSGDITLGADQTIGAISKTVNITGALSGTYSLDAYEGYPGDIVINASANTTNTPNGTYIADVEVETISSNSPSTSIYVFASATVLVTGARGEVQLQGILGGTGTVGDLYAQDGSTVSPGMSPGCLTAGNTNFADGSTLVIEIDGETACTEYDRLVVNGTVTIDDGALLDIQRLSSYQPANATTFTIVTNDGSDDVVGEFDGYPDGSTFTIDGVTYRISYSGGTGNDIVLTVVDASVDDPDTGLQHISNMIWISLASTLLATSLMLGAVYVAKRR